MPLRLASAFALSVAPLAAAAHPHVFIDAALTLDYGAEGDLSQVAVEWTYDEFYSLLIIEDLGLDPDGDGVLTAAEEAALQGFDADWEPGFQGSLYLQVDGRSVALEGPEDFSASYVEGRLVSRHVRPLAKPLDAALPLLLQVYDPEYYVQFGIPDLPQVQGRAGCDMTARIGDPYAAADAYARAVADALAEDDAAASAEVLSVDIGDAGADAIRVTCGGGS